MHSTGALPDRALASFLVGLDDVVEELWGAARYLDVSEPTFRLWMRRGALAPLPDSKPALVEHESLRRVGRAVRELRGRVVLWIGVPDEHACRP